MGEASSLDHWINRSIGGIHRQTPQLSTARHGDPYYLWMAGWRVRCGHAAQAHIPRAALDCSFSLAFDPTPSLTDLCVTLLMADSIKRPGVLRGGCLLPVNQCIIDASNVVSTCICIDAVCSCDGESHTQPRSLARSRPRCCLCDRCWCAFVRLLCGVF